MDRRRKKLISVTLRTIICVTAMYFVLRNVSLTDQATLTDGSKVAVVDLVERVFNDPKGLSRDDLADVEITILDEAGNRKVRVAELAKDDQGNYQIEFGLVTVWKRCDRSLILLALIVFAPVAVLQSIRFTWMIRAQEIDLSYWEGIKLSYAGNFLNFVALGNTGGDIFKAYYVSTHTNRKTEAVTTVFLDRVVGLTSLVLIAAIAMATKFDDPKIRELFPVVAIILLGIVFGVFIVFSRRFRSRIRIEALLDKLPFSEQLKRIDAATHRMREHKKLLILAVLTTLVLQGLAITAFTIAGIGLGMNSSVELYAGYFMNIAMALLVAAIPISYQGMGTMDGVLQISFLGAYGNYSEILFMGFAMRIIQLLWSLPGFLVPITGAHRPSKEKIEQLQALTSVSES